MAAKSTLSARIPAIIVAIGLMWCALQLHFYDGQHRYHGAAAMREGGDTISPAEWYKETMKEKLAELMRRNAIDANIYKTKANELIDALGTEYIEKKYGTASQDSVELAEKIKMANDAIKQSFAYTARVILEDMKTIDMSRNGHVLEDLEIEMDFFAIRLFRENLGFNLKIVPKITDSDMSEIVEKIYTVAGQIELFDMIRKGQLLENLDRSERSEIVEKIEKVAERIAMIKLLEMIRKGQSLQEEYSTITGYKLTTEYKDSTITIYDSDSIANEATKLTIANEDEDKQTKIYDFFMNLEKKEEPVAEEPVAVTGEEEEDEEEEETYDEKLKRLAGEMAETLVPTSNAAKTLQEKFADVLDKDDHLNETLNEFIETAERASAEMEVD